MVGPKRVFSELLMPKGVGVQITMVTMVTNSANHPIDRFLQIGRLGFFAEKPKIPNKVLLQGVNPKKPRVSTEDKHIVSFIPRIRIRMDFLRAP